MVTFYDLLRKSRVLGIFAIVGGASPFALCLLWAYFVQGHGLWRELTSTNSSGEHRYYLWIGLMAGGAIWIALASSVMLAMRRGMTSEQMAKAECLDGGAE